LARRFLGFLYEYTWEESLAVAQDAYRSWQQLLENTGGSLSLDKSSYTMVHWIPDAKLNKFRMATKRETPGELTMTTKEVTVIISRKEPQEACKDLGIFLAPDGNMTEQFRYCMKKAQSMNKVVPFLLCQEAKPMYSIILDIWDGRGIFSQSQRSLRLNATAFSPKINKPSFPKLVLIDTLPK
jgi:hypothetical protein